MLLVQDEMSVTSDGSNTHSSTLSDMEKNLGALLLLTFSKTLSCMLLIKSNSFSSMLLLLCFVSDETEED